MRKKIFVFLSVISVFLVALFNTSVYAQEVEEFPNTLIALEYLGYNWVASNERVYEYNVYYSLPYVLYDDYGDLDYILNHKFSSSYVFYKGEVKEETNSYKLEEKKILSNETWFIFRMTLSISMIDDLRSDISRSEFIRSFFSDNSVMYLTDRLTYRMIYLAGYIDFDYGYPYLLDGQVYYYYSPQVDLPSGERYFLHYFSDLIGTGEVLHGYDYIVIYYNLSERSKFLAPIIPVNDGYLLGFSYIVYDRLHDVTSFYNSKNELLYRREGLLYLEQPLILVPEDDVIKLSEERYYEEVYNKAYNEGYGKGYEEAYEKGYNEAYDEAYNKGYKKGKNEAVMEDLDLFGYLQALFGEQGLGRLLKLELLPGVSLGAVIMIPLAFFLVSFIMRWFR